MNNEKEIQIVRHFCRRCGEPHEIEIEIDRKKSNLQIMILASVGIGLIVLIWVWVFKWGVPLVKYIHNLD